MSYLGYVIAAYAVFALVLALDALGSWLRLRWALQAARRSAERQAARRTAAARSADAPVELSR